MSIEKVSVEDVQRTQNVVAEADRARTKKFRPKYVQRVPVDLSTAQSINAPLPVNFPFSAFEVIAATDSSGANDYTAVAKVVIGSKDNYNLNNYRECRLGEVVELDGEVNEGQVFWDAQSGKNMTILFYLGMKARSSAINAKITGGVSSSDGSAVDSAPLDSAGDQPSVTATGTAAVLIPANSSRSVATMNVAGGDIRVGDSSILVGTRGLLIKDGSSFQWRNTGALYVIAENGTPVVTGIEES